MKNDGCNLQRLIHAIESARGSGAHMKIESPKRILDKITNELREHDVVLTYTHQHHEIAVAIECRDRSRPVGSNAVEESQAPFDFRKYADAFKDMPIADAAVATILIGDRKVGLVLASQEDGTIGVSLVPEPAAAKK
jgi:hypothetical protein